MAGKSMTAESEVAEPMAPVPPVDVAFRRAALIQISKVSARRRRLGARRRQGIH